MTFSDFARQHGLAIRDLFASDRIQRCPTIEHPKSTNGAYWFDGLHGWIQNWEFGDAVTWYEDPSAKPLTDTDKAAWGAKRNELNDERRIAHKLAAEAAQTLINAAKVDVHGYLASKGFPEAKGFVTPDYRLLIPLRDFSTNGLNGLQTVALIENTWAKKMTYGTKAKGAVFFLGPRHNAEYWLVEGYATGLSVQMALKQMRLAATVVVTFSAGNLQFVASQLRGRRFVFADNDTSGTGQRVAGATSLPWTMSDVVGEDANDLHQRAGLMAVVKLVAKCRR
jgi:phage/plasmid primase-like uncharacterized protein